mgnify:CR=1 FL=1
MSKAIETAFAKFAVAFVAVAMLVSLVAPAASAQTTEELQAMINDLLAQVAGLQGQLGGTSSVGASVCPYTWTRSLNMGASGADVKALQQFLNADPETRVAASGVGSAGMETEYYGALTGAAVAKFQTKYRAEILTPLGLVNATTYFGPSTMAQANQLCVSAPSTGDDMDDDDMMDDDDDMMDDDDDSLSGSEASLEDFDLKDGDDTELQEGQENAPVAEATFDVEDGDIRIQRVDVAVDYTDSDNGTNEDDEPWDVFETISLWVDGDMIAEMDVDDEDEWEEDEPNNGDFRVRFTGLNQVFREGDEAEIVIGVTVANSTDINNGEASWDIFIPAEGIRGRDGAGVDQYTGNNAETVDIDVQEAGADDELDVKASSNDPDSTTLQLEDDEKSDWLTIFIFDLDTDDSTNDVEVEELRVDLTVTDEDGTTINDSSTVVNDVRLVVDGEEFDDFTASTSAGLAGEYTFDFDNNEFVIDAGDRQEVEVQVEFVALDGTGNADEGTAIYAEVDGTNISAEGADDITAGGSSTGEEHTLRTSGVILDLVSTDETFVENDDTTTADNEGTFELVFDVTAFEQDVFIESTTDRSTTTATEGVNFIVTRNNAEVLTGAESANIDSDADEVANGGSTYFRVDEGETERFTLTVEFDPATSGFNKVQLWALNFAETAGGALDTQRFTPPADFDTDSLSI